MSDEPNNEQESPMVHFKKTATPRRGGGQKQRTFSSDLSKEPPITPNAAIAAAASKQAAFSPPQQVGSTLNPPPGGPPMPVGPPPMKQMTSTGPPMLNLAPSTGGPPPLSSPSNASGSGFKIPPGAVPMLPIPASPSQPPSSLPTPTHHQTILTPSNQSSTNHYNFGSPQHARDASRDFTSQQQQQLPEQCYRQPNIIQSRGEVHYNQQESAVYRSLENGVSIARQNVQLAKQITYGQQSDNLTSLIPTVFVPTPIPPTAAQPNKDHVFLCGPVGASQKKDWKPRWAVLYRDRVDIYNKYGDSKAWQSWPLTGCLVQSTKDSPDAKPYISLTNVKGDQLFIRAEIPIASNSPPTPTATSQSQPDLDHAHKGWLNGLKVRSSYCDFILKCKETNIAFPDERLVHLYDAQYKAPFSMQLIAAYCPPDLYTKLPPIPAVYMYQIGKHPLTDLPYEGYCLDLAGGNIFPDQLGRLAGLLNDPDSLPIVGIKFEGAEIELKATEQLLMALASNPSSQLIQLDLSGAKCLDPMTATATNNELLDMITKFLISPHLTKFKHLVIRQSNLTSSFMNALSTKIQTASKPITAPLSVLDLSSNKLDDDALPALIGLLAHSEVIANNLNHLNLSWNLFVDLEQIATWLTLHRPNSTNYTLHQQAQAPFKPIKLQGLYLQGCSSIVDRSFIKLARSILWHICLTTLDCSQCLRLQDGGIAALTQALQINESVEVAKIGTHKLTLQGLTALRLFYRYGMATPNPELFGNDLSQFSLVGLASEANVQ